MAVHRAPLGEVAPRSVARKAFSELWAEIAARLWPRLDRRSRHARSAVVDEGHGGGDEAEEQHQADADDRDDVRLRDR